MSNADDRSSSVNKDACILSRTKRVSSAVLGCNIEACMRIERCREDCNDLSNPQAAGEHRSPIFSS